MKYIIAVLLVLWALPIFAQVPMTGAGLAKPTAAAGYTGPGDVQSGALAWYGLRAYSSADRGNPLINVCNVSDVACADMSSDATTGALVITTVGGSSCGVVVCTIKKFYDRGSGGRDMLQSNISNRFTLTLNCVGSLPCATSPTANAFNGYLNATSLTQAQPFSMSAVAKRTGGFTARGAWLGDTGGGILMGFADQADKATIFAGTIVRVTALDNVTHAVQSVFNGASSNTYIDGSASTGLSIGADTFASAFDLLNDGLNDELQGQFWETGLWGTDTTSTQSAMNSNQHTYWGF